MAGIRHFETIFARHPLPTWVFDPESMRFLEVNEAACREYGYSRDELLAMTILDIRPAQQQPLVLEDLSGPVRPDIAETRIWMHQRKDGSILEARVHASGIEFEGHQARLIIAENVTDELAAKRELAYRANHDIQTKLLNAEALAAMVQRWGDRPCRIACVQLHGLELIEDSLGAAASNMALRALASRLRRLGRRHGPVGRLRDDEFALAVSPVDAWPEALAELQAAIDRPIESTEGTHLLNAWIGTVDMPGDSTEPARAIALGRIAAHSARAEGVALLAYTPSMSQRASERLRLAARLRHAVEQHEFALVFQPILRIADGTTISLEALLRWPQADGCQIQPDEFIPVSEDTGLIVPLGSWVLRQAAHAHWRLAAAGLGDLSVAVNVSHAQIVHSNFASEITRVLDEYDLPRGALHIELTESVLMAHPDQTLAMLGQLHDHGICVSLDDFGTGFSNMSYLQQLPIDALKIDRSFVEHVQTDARNAFICRTLIALGHGLDLQVTAEGVETNDQYEWLRQHGCDQAQGFGLGRPAPLEEVIGRLTALA